MVWLSTELTSPASDVCVLSVVIFIDTILFVQLLAAELMDDFVWIGLGGVVASWLVCSFPERAVQVRALSGDTMLCSWARHLTLTVPLSTQEYKWVQANCWGNLTNCGGVTCDGLAFHPGEVEIFLATSCYRNWDKLRQLWAIRLQGFTFLHVCLNRHHTCLCDIFLLKYIIFVKALFSPRVNSTKFCTWRLLCSHMYNTQTASLSQPFDCISHTKRRPCRLQTADHAPCADHADWVLFAYNSFCITFFDSHVFRSTQSAWSALSAVCSLHGLHFGVNGIA